MTARPDAQRQLCSPLLLQVRESHFARLEALYGGEPPEHAFVLQGIGGKSNVDPYVDPQRWLDEAMADLATRADESLDSAVFRPLVIEFGPFGVHFVDRMLGCHVHWHEGQWWSDCLPSPVGRLQSPDLERDETWQLAQRLARGFLECDVTVPLFGLPTIASALNILINLCGPNALTAMVADPAAARHDLWVINDLLCDLHRWYIAHIPRDQLQPVVAAGRCQPRGYGQICGCSTHLISASMYRDLVAELDDCLLSVYEHGGMIHLCGVHTQHIPVWREMRSLRAVQVNDRAADDLETYFRELRGDQVIYLNPTRTMTVERAMEVTKGRRLVIVADLKEAPFADRPARS